MTNTKITLDFTPPPFTSLLLKTLLLSVNDIYTSYFDNRELSRKQLFRLIAGDLKGKGYALLAINIAINNLHSPRAQPAFQATGLYITKKALEMRGGLVYIPELCTAFPAPELADYALNGLQLSNSHAGWRVNCYVTGRKP